MENIFQSSVIVPVYNRANLVGKTIDSLLKQNKPFSEIIVVNDGSEDNTLNVLKRFGDKIKIINTKNKGMQSARNTGVKAAKTEWITFCDSDDIFVPDYLEKISVFLEKHREIKLLYSNFVRFSEKRKTKSRIDLAPDNLLSGAKVSNGFYYSIPDLFCRIIQFQLLWPTGMTISKALFDAMNGFDLQMYPYKSEDLEFTLRALLKTDCALSIQPLVYIREHEGKHSSNPLVRTMDEIIVLQYVDKNQELSDQYQKAILSGINMRGIKVFNLALKQKSFELCREYAHFLEEDKSSLINRLKLKLIEIKNKNLRLFIWFFFRVIV